MSMRSSDYALLAQESYHDPVLEKEFDLGGVTYTAIDTIDDPSTGLQATAYQRKDTREIVIAYRGTEFDREPLHDGGVDAGMVLTGVNAQEGKAAEFTQRVLERAENESKRSANPVEVTVTGHSLGGTLAEINAARFGLHGETFNAYGAASLFGVPEGGNQVIDHVRAGDPVSAASPHFGDVRVYAAQQDIDTLSKAGYRDDSGILSPRNPIKATDFDAHAIDNFVPDSKLLGQSIINPENQARYRAHEGMIDRYRNDVMDLRKGLSAAWEVPKEIGEGIERLGEEVVKDVAAAGHAIGNKVSGAWDTLTHPGSWFDHDKPAPRVDQPDHPDHALFRQAREGVQELDRQHQRPSDERSDRLAASLTVAAKQGDLQRIDQVALNGDATRAYAVQGDPQSAFKRVAEVNTQEAMATPLEKSSQILLQQGQTQQQAQQTAQATQQQQLTQTQPHTSL